MKTQKIFFVLAFVAMSFIMSPQAEAQGLKKLQVTNDSKYGSAIPPTNAQGAEIPQSGGISTSSSQVASQTGATLNANGMGSAGSLSGGQVFLNGADLDLKEMVQMMSTLTGREFIFDEKKITGKITIISDKAMSPDEAYQAFLSALEINGYTTVKTPTGLINIVQSKDTAGKPLDLYKDNSPREDRMITRIVQLNNISANEIAAILKSMGAKTTIVPYPTTNSLILTDTGANIDYLLSLVRELDKEGPQEVLDMVAVTYADAKDIADKISQIFESKDSSSSSSSVVRKRSSGKSGGGGEMEDVQNISKIIADERSNSLLIMGTKRAIVKVRALVARLDRPLEGSDGRIHVYQLRFAKSKEMADVLSKLVQDSQKDGKKAGAKNAKEGASSVDLEGGVQVTADEATNALIVVASPKDYNNLVSNVIEKLDRIRPQVYLEAIIMSLDVRKSSDLSASGLAGFINTLPGGDSLTAFGAILPSTPTAISTIAGASGGLGAGIISDRTVTFNTAEGASIEIPAVSAIISALATASDANVLSTPSILTLDNEDAKIQVGQDVPIPTASTLAGTGLSSTSVERKDIGIILEITPQISEFENVRLKIKQEITNLVAVDPQLGPTFDKKFVVTAVLARTRQTIVIGGLIDDKATVSTSKVPLLGDIPLIGMAFRSKSTIKTKTNLIVFITPYIVRNADDYREILEKKIQERNHFIDLNYGTGQRKFIRRAISDHAKDLLEFKCQPGDNFGACKGASQASSVEATQVPQTQSASSSASMPASVANTAPTTKSYEPPRKVVYR